jgi:hypothetical protein
MSQIAIDSVNAYGDDLEEIGLRPQDNEEQTHVV